MKCNHCNQETVGPKYCGHCGEILMAPCPECGEMEPMRRKYCKTKIRDGRKALKGFRETEKRKFLMSLKNTPLFIIIILIGSLTMAIAIYSGLFAVNHVPEPPEFFRLAVPKIMWATLAKWCFSLAVITYWLVFRLDKIDNERERKWHRRSLSVFLSLHPEYWDIREELNDTGWEPKLRLPE